MSDITLRHIYLEFREFYLWEAFKKSEGFLWYFNEVDLESALYKFRRSKEWSKNKRNITKSLFLKITTSYFKKLSRWLINGYPIHLFYSLGVLQLKKTIVNLGGKTLDYTTFNTTGQILIKNNGVTKTYRPKFYWDRRGTRKLKYIWAYSFAAVTERKKEATAFMNKGDNHKKYKKV